LSDIKGTDWDIFADVIVDIFSHILKGENENKFPSLQRAKEILKNEAFNHSTVPNIWTCPAYHGRVPSSLEDEEEELSPKQKYFMCR